MFGGYTVRALDGDSGTLRRPTTKASEHYLTVVGVAGDAERLVMLSIGVIDRIEPRSRTIHVDLTRSQIEASPSLPFALRLTGPWH